MNLLEDFVLVHRRRAAVVEFIDVYSGSCRASVDHQCVLDQREVGSVGREAVDCFAEVGVCCWGCWEVGGVGGGRRGEFVRELGEDAASLRFLRLNEG